MPLPTNFTFYVTGRDDLKKFKNSNINYFIGFNHTGWDDGYTQDIVSDGVNVEVGRIKIFEYHDAFTPEHKKMGLKLPDRTLLLELIKIYDEIKKELSEGRDVNILFGCAAGISRSTAACYVLLCYLLGEWNEREAWSLLINKREIAYPNSLMVKIADDILKLGGKMMFPLKHYTSKLYVGEKDDDVLLF
jgi:hypothetical protein